MRNKKVLLIVQAALIAAIYVVLTYFISAFNLASGAIQVRISEARSQTQTESLFPYRGL